MSTVEASRDERARAYARRADPIMGWLSVIFLVMFTVIVVFQELPRWLWIAFAVFQVIIWVAFVIDLVVRLSLADRRWHWLATHPLDVLAVLWPAFRPLKILAIIGDRSFRSGEAVVATTRAVVVASVILIWVCSVAVLAAERGRPDTSILNLGDAVWWAFVTIATVGYGDMVPVTVSGRIIGTILMVVGLALVAIITASVASWFVAGSRGSADEEEATRDAEARDKLLELERKIDLLLETQAKREDG